MLSTKYIPHFQMNGIPKYKTYNNELLKIYTSYILMWPEWESIKVCFVVEESPKRAELSHNIFFLLKNRFLTTKIENDC